MKRLYEVLEIEKGVTALVGGGGKTTCIETLADELIGEGHRVLVTTTTKMYKPSDPSILLIAPTLDEVEKHLEKRQRTVIAKEIVENKIIGISEEEIEKLQKIADFILVEADGARRMPLKIPRAYEPVIPRCAKHIIAVVGLRALGQRIKTVCCRSEEVGCFLSKSSEDKITIDDLYKIVTSPNGLAKSVEQRRFSVLLNQVDQCTEKDYGSIHSLGKKVLNEISHKVVISTLKNSKWMDIEGESLCVLL